MQQQLFKQNILESEVQVWLKRISILGSNWKLFERYSNHFTIRNADTFMFNWTVSGFLETETEMFQELYWKPQHDSMIA